MILPSRSIWLKVKHRIASAFASCHSSRLVAAWRRIVSADKRGGRRSRHWIDGWWSTVHQTRRRKTNRLRLETLETRCVLDVGMTGGGAIVLQDNCAITFSETTPDLTVTGWTVNWGDGTVETLDGSVGGSSHAYAALGNYSASATADTLDPDLNSGTDSAAVSVAVTAPPPPNNVVVTSDQSSSTEGTTVNYSASYLDAYPNLSNFTLAWAVTDANSNPVASGSGTTFPFTPSLKGTYTVSCSVTDSFNQSASGSTGLSVVDRPPSISGLSDATINEGSAAAFSGSVSDADVEDVLSVTADWKDGSPVETVPVTGGAFSTSHVYADDGTYSPILTVNSGGASSSVGATVTVNNVAPTLGISGASSINADQQYTLTLTSSDPGADTISSWLITWGDGTPTQQISGNPGSAVHSFAPGYYYTITASAIDEDGTWAAGNSQSVTVNPVAPVVSIGGSSTVNEGATYTLNLSQVAAGSGTINTWLISWGVGPAETVTGNPPSVTHVFPDGPAEVDVTATASDQYGSYDAGSQHVSVQNVAPTLTLGGDDSVVLGDDYTLTLSKSDPGDDTIASWLITWGDGTPTQRIDGNPSEAAHLFTSAGTYSVSAQATDEDGTFDAVGTKTVTVTPINVSIASNLSQAEGHEGTTAFTFTVSLSQASKQTVTVQAATADNTATVADNDYGAVSQTVTFNPGETSKEVTVYVNGDRKVEPDETFQVSLSTPTWSSISYSVVMGTIVNDDYAPTANDDNYDAYYSAATGFALNVDAANGVLANDTNNGGTLTVYDYTQPANGTVTVNNDGSFQYTPIAGFSGQFDSFTYRAYDGNNRSDWATVTIHVHAGPSLYVGDVTVINADGTASFTVTYTPPEAPSGSQSYDPVTVQWSTVDGTAVAGSDYQSSGGTLTFYYGDGPKTVTVPIIGTDSTDGGQKTFQLTASGSNADYASATGTIVDGDLDILNDDGTAVADSQEADLGGVVMTHTAGQDDLARLMIRAVASSGLGGKFQLQFDDSRFRVWRDQSATNAVISEQTDFDPGQDTTVYVEGIPDTSGDGQESSWNSQISLLWHDTSNSNQGSAPADKVKLTKTIVDIDAATISGNQSTGFLDDSLEETDGAFVPVNDDDDDYDGTPDVQNSIKDLRTDDDLLPVNLHVNSTASLLGKFVVSVPSGTSASFKLWQD
jgi:hypothetical protein